jgi:hypothetical protein
LRTAPASNRCLAALMPWPRRHRHHYAGVFAPHAALRARDPPELDAGFACSFDQSPWWDSTAAASEPSFRFDQTLNRSTIPQRCYCCGAGTPP